MIRLIIASPVPESSVDFNSWILMSRPEQLCMHNVLHDFKIEIFFIEIFFTFFQEILYCFKQHFLKIQRANILFEHVLLFLFVFKITWTKLIYTPRVIRPHNPHAIRTALRHYNVTYRHSHVPNVPNRV